MHYDNGKLRQLRTFSSALSCELQDVTVGWRERQLLVSLLWNLVLLAPLPQFFLCPSWCPSFHPPLPLPLWHSLKSPQSYWPWFLLICIRHFSFFGIWRWGTFPSLSEFTAISLCVFSKGLGYEMHIKYPLIPHYPTDKITMIMRQKF